MLQSIGSSLSVYNAGVPSNTTVQAVKRLQTDVLAYKPRIVVMQFGINDSAIDVWRKPPATEPRVSKEAFIANYRSMITATQKAGAKVILMTTNPLRWHSKTRELYGKPPYKPDAEDGFESPTLLAYNDALRALAKELNVPLVDVHAAYPAFAAKKKTTITDMLPDGMHPGDLGHRTVAELLVNGKVGKMRGSASKDAELRALPEGLIDPMLKTISFWNGDTKLAALHYYATHPMSYYGDGMVSHDFAGIARERRTQEDGVPHIYFTGCGGNIGAGKYNDGTPEMRPLLAERIHAAMVESEKGAKRVPLTTIAWKHVPVVLQPDPSFPEERMLKVLQNTETRPSTRITAALRLGFIRHREPIPFTSLHLGDDVCLIHLPGESFVEYQLFAQQQRPGGFVCTASYGDGVTGYIPLEHSFEEGGYEPTQAYAAPESEKTMKETIERLLRPTAK
jgi:lysophospholipase L1-like esterase